MEVVLPREALRFGDERHDLADVVLVGMLTDSWRGLVARVGRGLGLEASRTERPSADEVRGLLNEFRYRRHLIAAAEFEAWMSRSSLRMDDVVGVLQRQWLDDRFPDVLTSPEPGAQVPSVIWAEALVAGTLKTGVDTLIEWHVGFDWVASVELARSSHWTPSGDPGRAAEATKLALMDHAGGLRSLGRSGVFSRIMRLLSMEAGYRRFRSTAVTDRAVDARIAQHRFDWTTVEGGELSFDLEGAARETRMQVVGDGKSLAGVGAMLGIEPVLRRLEIRDAPGGIGPSLLAARDGDLVGPWREGERWRVLQVTARRDPESAADDSLRSRARDELLVEMVERLGAGKAVRSEYL